ncbi:MAG: aminoacyl-tRNA hydrolase [Candidatus Gracilibacteria bacterium]|nr:aminoacyl-tRNA hydrolase [Candidatus Gracilibacteria bacterium]
MKCIVGLGNPGKEYQKTRHNAGFLAIDFLQNELNFPEFEASKHFGVVSEGMIQGERLFLLKPATYMNVSGKSVSSLLTFYKIPPENLLVLSDDLDQDFGKIRFREKGSSGGQNGIKSIIETLGTETFSRIKIGIGRDSRFEVSDWVLSAFTKQELEELEHIFADELLEKTDIFLGKSLV